ncbi:hypothetical protein D3C81_1282390 [compost metagenome]
MRIIDVHRVVVERAHGAHETRQHGHRVGIAAEAAQEELQLLVNHRVVHHAVDELFLLLGVGQFALQQQVAGFQVIALACELFDRIAAVQQFALVTIDVGDLGVARRSRHEPRVIGELAGLSVQLANVDHVGANGTLVDRQLNAGGTIGER